MKDIRKIDKILTTSNLKKPVPEDIRKRILLSKERSFEAITAKGRGDTSVISMDEYTSIKSEKHGNRNGGIMKKLSIIGGMVAVIAIAAGVYFYTHSTMKSEFAVSNNVMEKAVVTFIVGEAKLKRGTSDVMKVAIGDKILKNDIITTGEKSNVTMQVSDTGIVRILENSEFSFSMIKQSGSTELSLLKGSVFSKVVKMGKGNSYKVKTPLCIAAVRGTEFLATYGNNSAEVQVLGGKVAVDSLDEKNQKIAEGSDGVKIDGKGMKLNDYKLSRIQQATLEKYAQTEYIDDIDGKTPEELKLIGDGVLKKEEMINDKINKIMGEEKLSPLDKLRSMGKPLTMLYLRDGSQIAGSIRSSNEKEISLDTGEGVISIPTEEVRRRMMIK